MNIHTIANYLNGLGDQGQTGFNFDCYPIDGEVEVVQVNVSGREEIPVFISVTDNQILCISYLWDETEVNPEKRTEMFESMLELNIPMPLSAFAKVDNKYVVYGALSLQSSLNEIEQEVAVLSDNCIEVIDEMVSYLK
ncbi:MAG: YjfI family protein [Shewanella sp.]|nr:YjfI family protein [Shewanella sp.]